MVIIIKDYMSYSDTVTALQSQLYSHSSTLIVLKSICHVKSHRSIDTEHNKIWTYNNAIQLT